MSEFDSGDDLFDGICTPPPTEEVKQKPAKRKQPDDEYGEYDDDEFAQIVEDCSEEIAAASAKRPKLDGRSHVSDLARGILANKFGYDSFRHEQEGAISAILNGDNALAIFPTGAGKSLCYQVTLSLVREHVIERQRDPMN